MNTNAFNTIAVLGGSLAQSDWIWIAALVCLIAGAWLLMDRLLRKGVYDENTGGTSNLGGAISNLQTMFDPAQRHVTEERQQKRAERDDSGEPPDL